MTYRYIPGYENLIVDIQILEYFFFLIFTNYFYYACDAAVIRAASIGQADFISVSLFIFKKLLKFDYFSIHCKLTGKCMKCHHFISLLQILL